MKKYTDQKNKRAEQTAGKIRFLCFIGAVVLLLSGCSLYIRIAPDRTYSSQERRMLTKRPKLSEKNFMSGKFQKKYETYLSEQFPRRTHLVTLRTQLSLLLGERDANGVYFGRDDYLLERYRMQDFNWKQVRKNIKRTASFLQSYPNAKVMFVPVKSSVLSEKLPLFAQTEGEDRFKELVASHIPHDQLVLVQDVLHAHRSEYIYYRTDHHWTTLGAYYAYEEWAKNMEFSPVLQEQFQITPVTDAFFGTTYAKVRTGGRADTILLYERIGKPAYVIDYNMGEFQSDSFYDLSRLEGEDPYSVFFGGNQALADIQTEKNTKDGRTLLIVKDSFGNCFAPFAAEHYARTIVVDLRYVNIPVGKLLRAYPADDILILYNSAQFMEDQNISKLK